MAKDTIYTDNFYEIGNHNLNGILQEHKCTTSSQIICSLFSIPYIYIDKCL